MKISILITVQLLMFVLFSFSQQLDTLLPSPGSQRNTNYATCRMFFKEPIKKGTGFVRIKQFSSNAEVKVIDITSSDVTVKENQIYFSSGFLPTGPSYYITVDSAAILDLNNSAFTGINNTYWNFSVISFLGIQPDNHALNINSVSPQDKSVISASPSQLEILWYEYILKQYGYINIRNYFNDTIVQKINVNSAAVTVSQLYSYITILPLTAGTYYVEVEPNAFINIPGTECFGTTKNNWRFTISGNDDFPLSVKSLSPVSGATGISYSYVTPPKFTITFNKIIKGPVNFMIKNYVTDQIVLNDYANLTDTSAVFFPSNLQSGTKYYIQLSTTDVGGYYTTTISNKDTWAFTTEPGPTSYNFNLNSCEPSFPTPPENYFSFRNSLGNEAWSCVATEGRDGTAARKMIGTNAGMPQSNRDWMVTSKLDLSNMTTPTLRFYSKTQNEGAPLKLFVSTNFYNSIPAIANATWVELNGKFPNANSNTWKLSDSIDLTAFKTKSTYISWQYNSDDISAAEWIVDNIEIYDAASIVTSISNTENPEYQLTVFGNPIKNNLIVGLNKQLWGKFSVRIFNMQGKLILQKEFTNTNQVKIPVTNLTKGVYVFQIANNNGFLKSTKIIID